MSFDILSKLGGLCEVIHTDKEYIFCKQKNQPFLIDFCICSSNRFVIGAVGGTRTHMVSRMILSHVRLPVPPHRRKLFSLVLCMWTTHNLSVTRTKDARTAKKSSATSAHTTSYTNTKFMRCLVFFFLFF